MPGDYMVIEVYVFNKLLQKGMYFDISENTFYVLLLSFPGQSISSVYANGLGSLKYSPDIILRYFIVSFLLFFIYSILKCIGT